MKTQALSLLIEKIKQAKRSEHDIELVAKFASLIRAINLSYSGNWESEHKPFVKDFYEKTRAGLPMPVLSVCGKSTQEIRFSFFLAYFLNRKGLDLSNPEQIRKFRQTYTVEIHLLYNR